MIEVGMMKQFIQKNRYPIIASILFSFVCFGFMLTNHTIGIDEETWILSNGSPTGWLYQGRLGIWLFDMIFARGGEYAPFLWDFSAVLFWNMSGVIFAFAYFRKRESITGVEVFFFCAYYASLPFVVGELLSFSMFNLQIGIAMICVAAAFLYTLEYLDDGKVKQAVKAFLLLCFAVSVFQAMVCLYVTAIVAYCLILLLEDKAIQKTVLYGIVICCSAVLAYYILNWTVLKVIGNDSYLTDSYWGWSDEKGVLHALFMAVANVGRVSLAIPIGDVRIYGGGVICCVTVLFIITSVILFFYKKGWQKRLGVFLLTVALVMAPFSLYIALGTYKTQGRMLIGLALSGAVQIVLLLQVIKICRIKKFVYAVLGILLFFNACNMNKLFYYETVAYEHDRAIANQVMYDIKSKGYDYKNKPVVFVGCLQMDEVDIQKSANVGASMFAWDDGNMDRMINFMETEGYVLQVPTAEQRQAAVSTASDMKLWPQEGSIVERDDSIVVCFSKPTGKWYKVNGVTNYGGVERGK